MNERTCIWCEQKLPASAFYTGKKDHKTYLTSYCRPCYSKWHAENRERRLIDMRVATASYKARRWGVADTLTKEEFRDLVIQVDGQCQSPGCTESWTEVHHLIPMSHGGENSLVNIILVCHGCHRAAHRFIKPMLQWLKN